MSTTATAARAPIVIANDNSGGSAFIIETGNVAAGIVVRNAKSYRFFAAHNDFRALDGTDFTTPTAAQKAADLVHAAAQLAAVRARYAPLTKKIKAREAGR
jgi:hypothetical protein